MDLRPTSRLIVRTGDCVGSELGPASPTCGEGWLLGSWARGRDPAWGRRARMSCKSCARAASEGSAAPVDFGGFPGCLRSVGYSRLVSMLRRRAPAKALAMVLALAMTAVGCGAFKERVCRRGQYAARAIAAPQTGRTCVPNDREPPTGYERFPPGQTPTYLEDDPATKGR